MHRLAAEAKGRAQFHLVERQLAEAQAAAHTVPSAGAARSTDEVPSASTEHSAALSQTAGASDGAKTGGERQNRFTPEQQARFDAYWKAKEAALARRPPGAVMPAGAPSKRRVHTTGLISALERPSAQTDARQRPRISVASVAVQFAAILAVGVVASVSVALVTGYRVACPTLPRCRGRTGRGGTLLVFKDADASAAAGYVHRLSYGSNA
jgi:hypothetical protein